jgi:microcompartment protein CcmK/EutM
MAKYAHLLDVSLDKGSANLSGIKAARGSEGPRALLAYYYAFLHVSAQFSDSLRFPIVVDAPNQQGQDASHLPKMLDFILSEAPADSQIIVATEDVGDLDVSKLVLLTYGGSKRQVLRSDAYEAVAAVFKPYQDAILTSTAGDPEPTK